MDTNDLNILIPLSYREKLNSQKNKLQTAEKIHKNGKDISIYRYIIGLGEKHFRSFGDEINSLIVDYPWIKKKNVRFILGELLINTQFSMLRQFMEKVQNEQKFPGYFYLTIFVNDEFLSAGIEEYGDYFDYNAYFEKTKDFIDYMYDDSETLDLDVDQEKISNLKELDESKLKMILKENHTLVIPDTSNKIALPMIESATNHDFFISSFYKNGEYMWKRIYFRVEND